MRAYALFVHRRHAFRSLDKLTKVNRACRTYLRTNLLPVTRLVDVYTQSVWVMRLSFHAWALVGPEHLLETCGELKPGQGGTRICWSRGRAATVNDVAAGFCHRKLVWMMFEGSNSFLNTSRSVKPSLEVPPEVLSIANTILEKAP